MTVNYFLTVILDSNAIVTTTSFLSYIFFLDLTHSILLLYLYISL